MKVLSMSDMFSAVDDFLFDAPYGFQRIASALQYYFGLKPTSVGMFFMIIGQSVYIVGASNAQPPNYVSIFMSSLLTLLFIAFAMRIDRTQQSGTKNWARISAYPFRMISLIVAMLTLISLTAAAYWRASDVLVAVAAYFMCCDFLPPSERHQWFGKTAESF